VGGAREVVKIGNGMPYEYRKPSHQERDEVVSYRREHGYPLHAPPHPLREAGYYLITAAIFEHKPIMAATSRRTEFETRQVECLFLKERCHNWD
jgi:hypothetical protein